MNTQNTSQKILGLSISNFKRLGVFQLDLKNKNLVVVSGKNESGKTSVIDAIHSALAGKKYFKKQIQDIIKRGEDQADVVIETDKFKIHRYWNSAGNDYIKIEDRDGIPQGREETLLSRFYSEYSRDPHRMVNMDEKEQIQFMFQILGLTDTLEELDIKRQETFDQRTQVNRELKQVQTTLDQLPEFEAIPEAPSTKDLLKQLEEIKSQNKKYYQVVKMVDDQKEEITTTTKEIVELKKKLADAEEDLAEQNGILSDLEEEAGQLAKLVVDPHEIEEQLENVEQLQEDKRNATKYFEQKNLKESKELESQGLTDDLERIDAKKKEVINGAEIPVEGMEIKDDVIYFQGTAVRDLSKAQSIIFWSKVFLSTNPGLKFMTLDDGESLDSQNLEAIRKFAEDNDLLYIMTKVDESGSQGIVLEEGQVIKDNYQEDQKPEQGQMEFIQQNKQEPKPEQNEES